MEEQQSLIKANQPMVERLAQLPQGLSFQQLVEYFQTRQKSLEFNGRFIGQTSSRDAAAAMNKAGRVPSDSKRGWFLTGRGGDDWSRYLLENGKVANYSSSGIRMSVKRGKLSPFDIMTLSAESSVGVTLGLTRDQLDFVRSLLR